MEALSTLCANEAHMLFTAVFAGFVSHPLCQMIARLFFVHHSSLG